MADVVEATPEIEATVASKTVDTKVVDDSKVVATEETTVVEVNGIHNGDESTPESVEVNNVAEVKQENGIEENGDVAVEEPVAAAAEGASVEATAVEAEGDAEAVVEEPKEEVPPKVILHQFPPGKEIPSLSPFCLKLETFLRINKIPYENQYGYKMGKKGKLPWIEYKGERKADSNLIIDYLNNTFEVNLDTDFSNEQVALGRAARSMLEENTYWALVYNRYVDNFNEFKKCIAPTSGGVIGFNVTQKMFQRKMRSNLDGHGLGRHTKEELYLIAEADLNALSVLLGDKQFLLGDSPSSFDCTVFGLCANILCTGMESSPLANYIKENAKNLTALCDRMKELYWPDWSTMTTGEKTEPSLKKGFSFRKKKTKAPKPEATVEETPTDEATTTEENTPEEKPVENGDVPSPSSEEAPAEAQTTPAETQPEEKPEAPADAEKATEPVPESESKTEA